MKSPLAKARDKWLNSKEGKGCCEGTTAGQYLQNRLELAFLAGAKFSDERIQELERTLIQLREQKRSVIRQLEERIKKLDEIIKKYARHTYECGLRFDHEKEIQPCDCGFEQALEGY